MPDQHVDFRDFCQHDVLDNMDYAALNSTCVALIFCFSGSTFCWTTVVTSDEKVNMKRRTTIECSTEAVLFQQCFASNVFFTNNKNYGSQHYGSTTNSC